MQLSIADDWDEWREDVSPAWQVALDVAIERAISGKFQGVAGLDWARRYASRTARPPRVITDRWPDGGEIVLRAQGSLEKLPGYVRIEPTLLERGDGSLLGVADGGIRACELAGLLPPKRDKWFPALDMPNLHRHLLRHGFDRLNADAGVRYPLNPLHLANEFLTLLRAVSDCNWRYPTKEDIILFTGTANYDARVPPIWPLNSGWCFLGMAEGKTEQNLIWNYRPEGWVYYDRNNTRHQGQHGVWRSTKELPDRGILILLPVCDFRG